MDRMVEALKTFEKESEIIFSMFYRRMTASAIGFQLNSIKREVACV